MGAIMDSGGNGGVNGGIMTCPDSGAAIPSAPRLRVWAQWKRSALPTDAGRGDGYFTPSIPLNTTAALVIMAKVRPDAWPTQAKFNGIHNVGHADHRPAAGRQQRHHLIDQGDVSDPDRRFQDQQRRGPEA